MLFDLGEEQIQSIRKVFDIFDKDGNGTINKQQIKEAFNQLNIKLSQNQIEDIFKKFDQNGNYSIEFEQFLTILYSTTEKDQSQAWMFEAFQIMDQDCDGRLNQAQLMKIVKLYQLPITEKEVKQILESVEEGLTKGINYEQFSNLLKF